MAKYLKEILHGKLGNTCRYLVLQALQLKVVLKLCCCRTLKSLNNCVTAAFLKTLMAVCCRHSEFKWCVCLKKLVQTNL